MKLAYFALQSFLTGLGACVALGMVTNTITVFWTDHLAHYGITPALIAQIDQTFKPSRCSP